MQTRRISVLAILAVFVVSFVTVPSASAFGAPQSSLLHASSPATSAITTVKENVSAGYAVFSPTGKSLTKMETTFNTPKSIPCSKTTIASVTAETALINATQLSSTSIKLQGGLFGFVLICSEGSLISEALYFLGNGNHNQTSLVPGINPGDTVSVTISLTSSKDSLSVQDLTTKGSVQTYSGKYGAVATAAEWIVGGIIPLAKFSKETFSATEVSTSGGTLKAFGSFSTIDKLVDYNSKTGDTLATPSAITSTSTGFSVTWKNSS
jgi:hypothetical protein